MNEKDITGGRWKKNAVLFLTSQNISLFGSALVQYAITWHITLETKSGVMMTVSIICGFLPTFFISPFAGVWADRFNRKMCIVFADSVTALSTLALAVLFMAGYQRLWLLFAASAVRALGAGIQSPAVGAFLPMFVPQDKLMRINALNGSIMSSVNLVSPMLSGALLTFARIESIFFIDVVTAAAAVFILAALIRVPVHAKALEKSGTGYFGDMAEGVRYINEHKYIRTMFIYCSMYFVLVSPLAFLTPLQVARSFGEDVWRLTAIEVTFAVGMTAGGIVMSTWGGFKNKVHTMVFSYFIVAVCTLALGVVPVFWVYLSLMVVAGVALPMFNTPFMVMLQERVETDYLGRVFGVLNMLSSSLMPASMLLFGPVADRVKIEWLLIVTGALMGVQTVFFGRNKRMIEAGEPLIPSKAEAE